MPGGAPGLPPPGVCGSRALEVLKPEPAAPAPRQTEETHGQRDERDPALMAHLEATIADKIAIANPKWR